MKTKKTTNTFKRPFDLLVMWLKKALIMTLVKLRWIYFHVSPRYIKFCVSHDDGESYFQHIKTGEIHCNFKWVD